jgi:CheY-like chemotaxis protein
MLNGRKAKLLVVDDNPDTCSLLAEQLEAWYDVIVADDGEEALQRLSKHGSAVGAVLLDLNMPRMDGFAFLEQVRRTYPDLPVIIHSANASMQNILRAQSLTIDGFLIKPAFQKDIIKKVEEAMRAKGRALNVLESQVVETRVRIEQIKHDMMALDKDYRANRAALQEMLAQAEQELRELREKIRKEVHRLEALTR